MLFVEMKLKPFELFDFVTKRKMFMFYLSRSIAKILYDYCLKLYTLLNYINVKICILFGYYLKSYARVIYFVVNKKRGIHVAPDVKKTQFIIVTNLYVTLLTTLDLLLIY